MNRVIFGDCRDTMRELKAQGVRVQCCVTSPPYYGLRDYGHPGQIGLEKTPAEYVAALVEVFDGVRELLADDGTLWLNIGDSYASGGRKTRDSDDKLVHRGMETRPVDPEGLKPKDLIGIPWMLAFALRADGWYLRQDIIWHKPNPMPESVTDRCTKAHEYLFLLSKSERYFFDAAAIAETSIYAPGCGQDEAPKGTFSGKWAEPGFGKRNDGAFRAIRETRNKRSVWTVPTVPYSGAHFATFPPALIEPCILAGSRSGDTVLDCFFGSGTTGEVAGNLGRNWIGCEINDQYAPLQQARTAQRGLAL